MTYEQRWQKTKSLRYEFQKLRESSLEASCWFKCN